MISSIHKGTISSIRYLVKNPRVIYSLIMYSLIFMYYIKHPINYLEFVTCLLLIQIVGILWGISITLKNKT